MQSMKDSNDSRSPTTDDLHEGLEDSLLAIRRNHRTGKLLTFREWCRVMKDVLDGLD